MAFKFSEVDDALALVHSIADDKRSAFANRLRHLHRLGFPPGIKAGRGKVASYEVGDVFLLAIALELNQLGLSPERAINAITSDLHAVGMGAGLVARAGPPVGRGFESPIFFYLDPAALNDLMYLRPGGDRAASSFFYAGAGIIKEKFESRAHEGYSRLALINASFVTYRTLSFLVGKGGRPDAYRALEQWAERTALEAKDGDT